MTTRRTEHTGQPAADGVRAVGGKLLPGGVIGDGRYRLLAHLGVDPRGGAHFWHARDGQLRRDVALTVLVGDPADREATLATRRTLERAAHAARFTSPSVSRVLDVLSVGNGIDPSEGVLGVVIADWFHDTDLVGLVADYPLPAGTAARLLEPLAAAVEQAHHAGLVLGVDHPQRVRVSPEGMLRLSFPGPLPGATLQDDVKGLGALLYLLLTGRWPLPGGPPGVPVAPLNPRGAPVAPNVLFPQIPLELAELAVRSLVDASIGGIRTSSAVLRVLQTAAQQAELAEQTELLDPVAEEEPDGTVWTTRRPATDDGRRRKLAIGVTVLTVATVGVLAWLGMQLISFFGDTSAPAAGPPALTTTASPTSPPGSVTPPPQNDAPPAATAGGPVKPKDVQVYSVKGDKDNARTIRRVTDASPKTVWSTDKYKQPFPSLKPGIGMMVTFEEAVRLARITVDSPSEGSVVEIRSAPSATPKLDETTVITTSTLGNGRTDIPLPAVEPGRHVLVWITRLGVSGKDNVTQIREIEFARAQ